MDKRYSFQLSSCVVGVLRLARGKYCLRLVTAVRYPHPKQKGWFPSRVGEQKSLGILTARVCLLSGPYIGVSDEIMPIQQRMYPGGQRVNVGLELDGLITSLVSEYFLWLTAFSGTGGVIFEMVGA